MGLVGVQVMNPPTPTRCLNCGKLEASTSCSLCKVSKVASQEEPFNCQMEGKPCDRWCGAIPCEGEVDTTATVEGFNIFAELDRVQKILYPKG